MVVTTGRGPADVGGEDAEVVEEAEVVVVEAAGLFDEQAAMTSPARGRSPRVRSRRA
jgi:hypothetical protein